MEKMVQSEGLRNHLILNKCQEAKDPTLETNERQVARNKGQEAGTREGSKDDTKIGFEEGSVPMIWVLKMAVEVAL